MAGRPCRCRPPALAAGDAPEDEEEEEGAGDSGPDPSEEAAAPDQATGDPGHFLAKFNCAAAIGVVEGPDSARSRLKRYDFAVESTLGPGAFHRSKVGHFSALSHQGGGQWRMGDDGHTIMQPCAAH